jgi:hypothetical protein
MKRYIALLLSLVVAVWIAPQSFAVPKTITAGLGSIYTPPVAAENFLLSGKNVIYYANEESETADILVTSFDFTNTKSWQLRIDSGADEVVSSASTDPLGNFWLVGSASLPVQSETSTSNAGIDNPDGVTDDPTPALRSDMNQLAMWKISQKGELLATYLSPQKSVPLVTGVSAKNSGISITGILENKPFLLTATSAGIFGKTVFLGSSKTEINSVIRSEDGTTSLYGSSAETLAGKKLMGKRDGILMKLSKSGAITSLVRSSANGASRGWTSGDSTNLLSGYVLTGAKTEIAITKFTSAFAPTWTTRYAGMGTPISISGGGFSYLAFTSKSTIPGISGWKPNEPTLIVLSFNGKGVLQAATSLPGLLTPLNLAYSRDRGVLGLASSSDGSVSIFTLVSR